MHRLAATPGGWNPDTEGVIFVEQTPAELVILTAADTDIQTLHRAIARLPQDFPAVRGVNLLNLQQQLTIDTYADQVLTQARAIILRLIGGRSYWSYGLEVLKETIGRTGAALWVLPGDDFPDPDLISHSTVPLAQVTMLGQYLTEGGVENFTQALQYVADRSLGRAYHPLPPRAIPRVGIYGWQAAGKNAPVPVGEMVSGAPWGEQAPGVGILFYRAHYLAGNTDPIDALCQALVDRGLQPLPIFVSSLRDPDIQADVLQYCQTKDGQVQAILNTTSFSITSIEGSSTPNAPPGLWSQLDVPVLQVILSGGTLERWQENWQGLSPRDMAMNVALPEVDGRIITKVVSFKAVQARNPLLEADVVRYEPVADRIAFVADLTANWVRLRQTPVQERKVALILANYPTKDGRLANGVGLDTPASCVAILQALAQAGYQMGPIPATSEELIRQLTQGVTNDPEGRSWRPIPQALSLESYQQYLQTLPPEVRQSLEQRWGEPALEEPTGTTSPQFRGFPIAGIQIGHIFIGIQPSRGYDQDPSLNYHAPDLEPTHQYLAFYHWLRAEFGAQAIVHVGKHGNLEWLPGKSIALSAACFPEVALGAMPHLYPFIVNDPGEGAQAKRRTQAVILDHLTPPMTRAELYGALATLDRLVDEYYEAQTLDPGRTKLILEQLAKLVHQENLQRDLGITANQNSPLDLLPKLSGYLCELKESQIRDGLHIFGRCPEGLQLRDLVVAIARHPGPGQPGLTRAIAQDWGLDFDPLTADPALLLTVPPDPLGGCHTIGDGIERIEHQAQKLVEALITGEDPLVIAETSPQTALALAWIATTLLPALDQTDQEMTHLLRGLEGRYVPAGASGAPTRGRPEVLPTGRNFYSVDIRAVPTESAWSVGRKAAEALVERYTQDQGEYPRTLGLSIWGTATMRTGGDDMAEALALLGVCPVWDGPSRRVVDFEILSLGVLGRPRVDVTLRVSGFFRDAFPNLMDLFNQAVAAVAALEEPADQNPLAAQVRQETQDWQAQGVGPEEARRRSGYRLFSSKPGAYGAGLQGLLEAQNWDSEGDLAQAYRNWSSYAYGLGATSEGTPRDQGIAAPEAFEQRLKQMQIVLQNQDNREHDLLDSDDYYQFQGGLTVAIRSLTGQNPQVYFGDHSLAENPKVRLLQEEISRVYRSRVVNPKWIGGMMRHGYKGAFEMAATVDFLFAYDATTHCVEDYMYQGVAEAYLLDPAVQQFIQEQNPWALRDMGERLIEAHQRGLWQDVSPQMLDQLRAIVHEAEATLEGMNSPKIQTL